MSGEYVWKILGGGFKDGTNSVAELSVLGNAIDHGTIAVEEPIWGSKMRNEGKRS